MLQFLAERRNALPLIGLFVVCFTLMTLSVRFRGSSTLMDKALLTAVGTAVQIADVPRRWSVSAWQRFQLLKNAQEENVELKRRLEVLRAEHVQIRELRAEIARLEKLLGASRSLTTPVRLARIVARGESIYGKALIVDLGSGDGVRKNMPVIHQEGLVGRIFRVGRNVSQVLTLLDSRSAVHVVVQGSRAQGVFSTSPDAHGEVRYMPGDAGVRQLDLLVSSGLGGIFPKGLPVARVTRVLDTKQLFPKVEAKALADFTKLEEVMILMTQPREIPWK